ncbi:MAG: DNA polymerase III subunit chi [Alcanivorax sp.]
MTEVRFYHLQNQSQKQALPLLLSKAVERGHRIVVKLRDAHAVADMDDHLWGYDPNSFLPHGSAKSGNAEDQPIWLTTGDDNPNKADVLIIGQGASSEHHGDYKMCCEVFSGQDQEAVQEARKRWKLYKEKEYDVTYWQQNERGGWDKKA